MAKIADKYYKINPWMIIEDGFDPAYAEVSESIFSLGNEYMGVRGYFEEGYSGQSLIGNYFNGVYEAQKTEGSHYKSIIEHTEFIVNSVDWLYLRICIDEEIVDLHKSKFRDFKRVLDLKSGTLTRSYIWILEDKRELQIEFERFLSMKNSHCAGQRVVMTPLNFSGVIRVISGLDFTQKHQMVNKNLWESEGCKVGEGYCSILANTLNTKLSVYSYCRFAGDALELDDKVEDKKVLKHFHYKVTQGIPVSFTRMVLNITRKGTFSEDYHTFNARLNEEVEKFHHLDYETLKRENTKWWADMWASSDIVIEGDELNQQGIRFCIFQMHQTYHGADKGTIIGAKGLTGEAYSGNTFWDTETYCLPFYIFNNLEAAKSLLEYRYLTLPRAKERANTLNCEGAFYPIATISGRECCSLWQHANLQLQASTAVVYAFWHYEQITKDVSYVYEKGLPVLIEVSRMLASRGDWNATHTRYGFYGVMGPDEFQMMVNNNCYTNYMGKFAFEYTLDLLRRLQLEDITVYQNLLDEMKVVESELEIWRRMAWQMFIPYDEESKLFEQHEGYFTLPHIDVDQIPVEEFPLYSHWAYDRIYRNDMIKQPDVLMIMLLMNGQFTWEQLKSNYDFYEPRCIHESSLSPSVHSILASQLHKHEEAYQFFGFATRMDLDNYNRNTREGLHTTSIAAAWMNIVYGFGGMRSDGEFLSFNPSIPKAWNRYTFMIHYQKDRIHVEIGKDSANFYTKEGTRVQIQIYGKLVIIHGENTIVPIPEEWRG